MHTYEAFSYDAKFSFATTMPNTEEPGETFFNVLILSGLRKNWPHPTGTQSGAFWAFWRWGAQKLSYTCTHTGLTSSTAVPDK